MASDYDDMEDTHAAVMSVLDQYDIEVPYDYIATLMRLPNAFGEGAACVVCHTSNDPKKSPAGLDLSTCEGIKKGSVNGPIIVPGDFHKGNFRRRMRDNRMPLGVRFDVPSDLPAILEIKKWIENGAKNDDQFKQKVLPTFKDPTAYGGEQACTECHMSNQEPPSFHELDMTTYEGIMLGADSVAKAEEGKPPVKIVIPGEVMKSKLYLRLVENRMPGGIGASEDRDHPNLQLMFEWIEHGAKCD
ncbi:c-type cytochrome domain-containing protein [Magnetovibrio sp. PR-2]|uniref:c-type cytochrome domain-containing protein n=1 Tax=Magnetovibrio sp. PR-2 TaxID=3120356 RepID=UPI002FCE294C